jgi:hypothetical protein
MKNINNFTNIKPILIKIEIRVVSNLLNNFQLLTEGDLL